MSDHQEPQARKARSEAIPRSEGVPYIDYLRLCAPGSAPIELASIDEEEPDEQDCDPAGLDGDVAVERRHALNWLVNRDWAWDDVSTNT